MDGGKLRLWARIAAEWCYIVFGLALGLNLLGSVATATDGYYDTTVARVSFGLAIAAALALTGYLGLRRDAPRLRGE